MSRHSPSIKEWEDLRFPATAINPPGQASDPDVEASSGLLLFDAAATEVVFVAAQLSHSWAEGTAIVPHVHWQKTTSASGNVLWRLEYKWAPIGEVMDAAFTTVDASTPIGATPDTDTADYHMITSFGDVDVSGKNVSDMFIFKVSRVGGDAADTYAADARLLEIDIHYQKNSLGSEYEGRKGPGQK